MATMTAKISIIFATLIVGIIAPKGPTAYAQTSFTKSDLKLLIDSLVSKDWSKEDLTTLFTKSSFSKMPGMVKLNVTNPVKLEAKTYAHFAETPALNRALDFRHKWQTILKSAAEKFAVDEEVILAILLIETNLGNYMGKHQLMSIFPSVFVESHKLLHDPKTKTDQSLFKRVQRKKLWALEQLKALLTMKKKHRINVFDLKGSYAGAIGICQFLPSSYVNYAVSSSIRDPDLFSPPDAIMSVGHYLSSHGYIKGITKKDNRKAVYAYNRSDVYVDIVLKVAKNLQTLIKPT